MMGPAFSDTELAVNRVMRWRRDPRVFVREAIGAMPEPWQDEALRRIAIGKKRIAVRSGHGVGKTFLEAVVIFWFGVCFRDAKIPTTAPSAHQLHDLLWGELGIVKNKMMERLPDIASQIDIRNDEVLFRFSGSRAYARTSRKENPDALQGFHAKHLLFVIDEASGVEEKVFEVAQGALSTEGAMVLMCGNPTRTSGYFHRAHTTARDRWSTMKVGCAQSSRVSAEYVSGMEKDYGVDSNVYRVRVLGDFPAASDDAVIPLDWVEAAVMRDIIAPPVKSIWGLDVARFGDDSSSLCKRRGTVILEPLKTWRNKDTMQTSGIVKAEWDNTPADQRPAEIMVDVIGIGAGVCDRLKEMGLPARGVNVAEQPSALLRFSRLRDELWWKGREWFEGRACRIPNDNALIGDLCGITFKMLSTGKIEVESKADMKKRGLKSPDRADAFCLTLAGDPTAGNWGSLSGKLDYSKSSKGLA